MTEKASAGGIKESGEKVKRRSTRLPSKVALGILIKFVCT